MNVVNTTDCSVIIS